MAEIRVTVWGEKIAITVHQDPRVKSKWVAIGDYMGESIRAEGRSEKAAIESWAIQARRLGNP